MINYETIFNEIIDKAIDKSKKEKIEGKKDVIIKFFDIVDKINENRINNGLIDIRKNYFDQDVTELSIGDITSFGVKIGTINQKTNGIFIEDVFYNKEKREFISKGQYGIDGKKINIIDKEKIELLIDGPKISTDLIPYIANTLGTSIEYDDGTIFSIIKDNFDFEKGKFTLNINNNYNEDIYVYANILDFEKSVDYNFNLLILFGIEGYKEYLSEYFSEKDSYLIIENVLFNDTRNIEYITKNYNGTETNIGTGSQGANCFIDANADNFNKFMEELLK